MAYQTNSGSFFDYLTQMLVENKVSETIQILSDASSSDSTLNGDLKFLKLRANKKLMVSAGGIVNPPKTQIQDVIKLITSKGMLNISDVIAEAFNAPQFL